MAVKLTPGARRGQDIWNVPLNEVVVPKQNPARAMEPPEEVFEEFYQKFISNPKGQHTPAKVLKLPDGRVELKDGKQRYKALKRLERETGIPRMLMVTAFKGSEEEAFALAVSSNEDSIPSSPIDQAYQIDQWIHKYKKTKAEVAAKYGQSEAWVTGRLDLMSLPESVRKLGHEGYIKADGLLMMAKMTPELLEPTLQLAAEIESQKKGVPVELPLTEEPAPESETAQSAVVGKASAKPAKGKVAGTVSSSSLLEAATQTGALGNRAPQMKMSELLKYLKNYRETAIEGDRRAEFLGVIEDFIARKLTPKQMDNRLEKYIPDEPKKGKK